MPAVIKLDCDAASLIDTAFDVAGKLEISKENPRVEILITGKLILNFSEKTNNSLIVIMESKK